MKTICRAYDMLKRDRKESWAYLLTLTLSASLLLVFVNIQNDTNFLAQITDINNPVLRFNSLVALGCVTLMIAVVCAINCYVANTYFLKAKAQELCVYLSSGMNIVALAKYLLLQNLMILIAALPIGILIAIGLNPLVNFIIYQLLGITGSLFTIHFEGLLAWLCILFFEIFYLFLINIGYAYKAELKDLLDEHAMMRIPDLRLIKTPAICYPILIVISFIIILLLPAKAVFFSVCLVFAFVGVKGYLENYLPKRRGNQVVKHKGMQSEKIILQGNLHAMLKNCNLYILMIFLLVASMSCIMTKGMLLPYVQIVMGVAYILLLLMMGASLYFKIMLEAKKRKQEFIQLALLGMPTREALLRKEILSLFLYIIVFPLVFSLLLCGRFFLSAQMTLGMCGFLIGSYLLIFLLTGFLSMKYYEEIVLEKRGAEHE